MTLAVSLSDLPMNISIECEYPTIPSFIPFNSPVHAWAATERCWTFTVGDNLLNAAPTSVCIAGGRLTFIPLFDIYDTETQF